MEGDRDIFAPCRFSSRLRAGPPSPSRGEWGPPPNRRPANPVQYCAVVPWDCEGRRDGAARRRSAAGRPVPRGRGAGARRPASEGRRSRTPPDVLRSPRTAQGSQDRDPLSRRKSSIPGRWRPAACDADPAVICAKVRALAAQAHRTLVLSEGSPRGSTSCCARSATSAAWSPGPRSPTGTATPSRTGSRTSGTTPSGSGPRWPCGTSWRPTIPWSRTCPRASSARTGRAATPSPTGASAPGWAVRRRRSAARPTSTSSPPRRRGSTRGTIARCSGRAGSPSGSSSTCGRMGRCAGSPWSRRRSRTSAAGPSGCRRCSGTSRSRSGPSAAWRCNTAWRGPWPNRPRCARRPPRSSGSSASAWGGSTARSGAWTPPRRSCGAWRPGGGCRRRTWRSSRPGAGRWASPRASGCPAASGPRAGPSGSATWPARPIARGPRRPRRPGSGRRSGSRSCAGRRSWAS
jgi:hypothetical protein